MDLPDHNSDENHNSDKKLVISFIIFSLTFFVLAMIALFIVIYTSDATELFKEANELFHKTGLPTWWLP